MYTIKGQRAHHLFLPSVKPKEPENPVLELLREALARASGK